MKSGLLVEIPSHLPAFALVDNRTSLLIYLLTHVEQHRVRIKFATLIELQLGL